MTLHGGHVLCFRGFLFNAALNLPGCNAYRSFPMELIRADVLVWRAHFQSRAKKCFPDFTVLHHAVVAFEACGDLDSHSLTGLLDSALTACMARYHFS